MPLTPPRTASGTSLRHAARAAALSTIVALALPAVAAAAPPKRVVALTPYAANTMALLGVRPIAVGQVSSGGANVYASALSEVPRLTLTHPGGPNLEQLSGLRADFVFTSQAWSRGTAGMKRLGLRVANREPRRVSDVPRQTKRIAKLLGKRDAGERLAKAQQAQINAATKNIKRRPKVLVVLGVGSTPYAFLPNSWGGDVVRRAGGTLITAGLKANGGYARISDEAVVARNPDVIIAVPHGQPKDINKIAAELRARPGWKTTNAARDKRIYLATSNTLLQPISGAGTTIAGVRRLLGN
jgi:iron complex transport system substrate-binding protein